MQCLFENNMATTPGFRLVQINTHLMTHRDLLAVILYSIGCLVETSCLILVFMN